MIEFPHLQCQKGDIAPIVLMPSNPAKADRIAERFSDARNIGRYREFVSWTGTYNGLPISTISTGIGCPSTAIAVEEAIGAGAKIVIRVGTCGGAWRGDIACGSVILPTACIREEGTTQEYMPVSFPAVADIDVISCLRDSARALHFPAFCGINRCHDSYYGSSMVKERWESWMRGARVTDAHQPILSSEMECSAFYIIASLRGAKAGAVLAVNADPELLFGDDQSVPTMIADKPEAAASEERSIELVLNALPMLHQLIKA